MNVVIDGFIVYRGRIVDKFCIGCWFVVGFIMSMIDY